MIFKYTPPPPGGYSGMPVVRIALRWRGQAVTVDALVDSGASMTIMPFDVGRQLGLVWEDQTRPFSLGGPLTGLHGFIIPAYGTIDGLPQVPLALGWIEDTERPVRPLLGQCNFFQQFRVCFDAAEQTFTLEPKVNRV